MANIKCNNLTSLGTTLACACPFNPSPEPFACPLTGLEEELIINGLWFDKLIMHSCDGVVCTLMSCRRDLWFNVVHRMDRLLMSL